MKRELRKKSKRSVSLETTPDIAEPFHSPWTELLLLMGMEMAHA